MIVTVWTRKIVIVKHKKYCFNINCCNKNCNSNVDFVEKWRKFQILTHVAIFSRDAATLYERVSVRWLVGWSVRPSVGWLRFRQNR